MNDRDDNAGRLEFNMGAQGSTAQIKIKNVRIEVVEWDLRGLDHKASRSHGIEECESRIGQMVLRIKSDRAKGRNG